jgi:hypothetical protein
MLGIKREFVRNIVADNSGANATGAAMVVPMEGIVSLDYVKACSYLRNDPWFEVVPVNSNSIR